MLREKQTSLSSDSFTTGAVIPSPEHSEETVPAVGASDAASSAGKPVESQQDIDLDVSRACWPGIVSKAAALSEVCSRLERMPSNAHVEGLLQQLSDLEEWQPSKGQKTQKCFAQSRNETGCQTKRREAGGVAQEMQAAILRGGNLLMEKGASAALWWNHKPLQLRRKRPREELFEQ